MRIIIEMQGGLVQNVFCPDSPDAQYTLVDWDALDTSNVGDDDDEPMSSSGPVDDWSSADPLLTKIVFSVEAGSYMTVAQVREMLP